MPYSKAYIKHFILLSHKLLNVFKKLVILFSNNDTKRIYAVKSQHF